MKKMFMIGVACLSLIHADWQSDYKEAGKRMKKNEYQEAKSLYLKSIEQDSTQTDPQIDLVRCLFILKEYEESLRWINNIEKCTSTKTHEMEQKCRLYRALNNGLLGNKEEYRKHMDEYWKLNPDNPRIEETETHLFLLNVPDHPCVKATIQKALEMREDIEDIKFEGSVCICKKKAFEKPIAEDDPQDCGCGCGKKPINKKKVKKEDQVKQNCKNLCDDIEITAAAFCGSVFKCWPCQGACLLAVKYIKTILCYGCCNKGGWGKTCASHFEDIRKYMEIPCYRGEGDDDFCIS